jgi:hypothetical protein
MKFRALRLLAGASEIILPRAIGAERFSAGICRAPGKVCNRSVCENRLVQ